MGGRREEVVDGRETRRGGRREEEGRQYMMGGVR